MHGLDDDPRRQIDLDETAPPVGIDGAVLHELCAHALEAQPDECCGLVTGNDLARYQAVYRCRNEMTARHIADPVAFPRDGTEAYLMNELDYLRGQSEAEEAGRKVTAVYHSHVGAGVYLSEMDLEFACAPLFPFPDAAQIVLAVWDEIVSGVGIFERDPVTGRFVSAPLVVAGDA